MRALLARSGVLWLLVVATAQPLYQRRFYLSTPQPHGRPLALLLASPSVSGLLRHALRAGAACAPRRVCDIFAHSKTSTSRRSSRRIAVRRHRPVRRPSVFWVGEREAEEQRLQGTQQGDDLMEVGGVEGSADGELSNDEDNAAQSRDAPAHPSSLLPLAK